MKSENQNVYYQACYAHPDTGWEVVNVSADMPQALVNDFSAVERGSAGAVSSAFAPTGSNETQASMLEIYCRNNAIGHVRVKYGISDSQGRPVSFAQGFIFPDAFNMLKSPCDVLGLSRDNFISERFTADEAAEIRKTPGAFNRALIDGSVPHGEPEPLSMTAPYTVEGAMARCGLSDEAYRTLLYAVYSQLISSNADKNLYVKTDGSEEYALHLLYLIYQAVPYSMRPLLSASTYIHVGQHNTKLLFCAEIPQGVPYVDLASGDNNVMNDTVRRRLEERNPFIRAMVDACLEGNADRMARSFDAFFVMTGDEKLASMRAMNVAYSFLKGDCDAQQAVQALASGV